MTLAEKLSWFSVGLNLIALSANLWMMRDQTNRRRIQPRRPGGNVT